jgi:Putative zinc-binding metallo-peptidase
MTSSQGFRESNLFGAPIRDLGLKIAGTRLEPVIDEFRAELAQRALRVAPRFHLSTEWGVPFGTVVIGIPFYLAHPDLTALHGEQVGHIEGFNRTDILRYLRHEMGHVVNYAYRLYDREAWVKLFGSITQPYREEYRPQPFSRRFVRHLPGWYAQKHPDEDWSETFAVWMTPERDWRTDYAQLPTALAKLDYCARTLAELGEPLVTATDLDEDVSGIHYSLAQYYETYSADPEAGAAGLDGDLRAIFDDLKEVDDGSAHETRPAAELIRRHERQLMANVFRWTGHFPEKTRSLVRHMAKRAEVLKQVYAREAEDEAVVAVTTLVTSLAMNFVHRGAYFPEAPPSAPEAPPSAPEAPPPTAEAEEPPPKAAEPRVETPEESSEPPPPAESPPSERQELKRASR